MNEKIAKKNEDRAKEVPKKDPIANESFKFPKTAVLDYLMLDILNTNQI